MFNGSKDLFRASLFKKKLNFNRYDSDHRKINRFMLLGQQSSSKKIPRRRIIEGWFIINTCIYILSTYTVWKVNGWGLGRLWNETRERWRRRWWWWAIKVNWTVWMVKDKSREGTKFFGLILFLCIFNLVWMFPFKQQSLGRFPNNAEEPTLKNQLGTNIDSSNRQLVVRRKLLIDLQRINNFEDDESQPCVVWSNTDVQHVFLVTPNWFSTFFRCVF